MPGIPLFSVLMMVAWTGWAEAGQGSLPDMLVDSALLSPLFHHNSVQHPLKSEQRRPSVLLWLLHGQLCSAPYNHHN